jgi:hypothetical protein
MGNCTGRRVGHGRIDLDAVVYALGKLAVDTYAINQAGVIFRHADDEETPTRVCKRRRLLVQGTDGLHHPGFCRP